MPVMKSGQPAPPTRAPVVLDIGDVESRVMRALAEARSQAEIIVREAQHDVARLAAAAEQRAHVIGFDQGFIDGREEGLRQGRESALRAAREESAEIIQRWTAAIDDWEASRDQFLEDSREEILRFAFALAERVVHRLVHTDPAIVANQLREACRHLRRPGSLQVAIHPSDRAAIEQILPEIVAALGESVHIHLHEDATIGRGGCVVATVAGHVDATIATQLDRLAEALLRDGRLIERPPLERASNAP
ncbi:MAG TPA: FliH/SctL family protein [Phycisphaerales bacterium]|nr:FliH/SctL family protein [Phycisphaerales bacterium]